MTWERRLWFSDIWKTMCSMFEKYWFSNVWLSSHWTKNRCFFQILSFQVSSGRWFLARISGVWEVDACGESQVDGCGRSSDTSPVSTISVSIWVPFVIWEVFTTITHRIHGAGIYMLTLGVYWWDPCYHIYHTWILWVIGKQPDIFRMYFWLKLGFQERWPPHTGMMMSLVGNESWTAARLSVATGEEDTNINLGKL